MRKAPKLLILCGAASTTVLLSTLFIPPPDFVASVPRSAVLMDADTTWLAGKPSENEQWCFEPSLQYPEKYYRALITYEDKRFFSHIGVDAIALARALLNNLKNKAIKSGASTLTMQLARLHYGNKSRNAWNKLAEIHLAIRAEIYMSKEQILSAYASAAPFGGNIVGIEAASMRYFNRLPHDLSWAEAALLAVLPNRPAVLFPDKFNPLLFKKRNRLLKKLYLQNIIDSIDYTLAIREPLPDGLVSIPVLATHALNKCISATGKQQTFYTTLQASIQAAATAAVRVHMPYFSANGIHNAAVMVLDVETGHVKAYVANVTDNVTKPYTGFVDCIAAPRSTGSILKPMLYACALQEGLYTPYSLIPDIPTQIGGYVPKNHDLTYDGAVPFKNTVYRSLNVPSVRVLQHYGVPKFHQMLRKMGLTTFSKPPSHYGLSLILGGGEATLWDVCGVYASMARTLNHYNRFNGVYFNKDWHAPILLKTDSNHRYFSEKSLKTAPVLSASVIWHTFEAMKEVYRPDLEEGWKNFPNANTIAWKTGTSFGNRDAWAVGVTPDFVVGVWVGNANGEGRAELTGIKAAAPVLFDVFRLLPQTKWFSPPRNDMQKMAVCAQSGFKAVACCVNTDTVLLSVKSKTVENCMYCKAYFIHPSTGFRVHSDCYSVHHMQKHCGFQLPPVMETYYIKQHPTYRTLPPFDKSCMSYIAAQTAEIVYPVNGSKIFLPKNFNGEKEQLVAKASVNAYHKTLHWHLNHTYIGSTTSEHKMPLVVPAGAYTLSITDEWGKHNEVRFEIVN